MAGYLEETIRSVLDQDYPDVEYIVMDGGSTDGTLAILERYRDRLRFESGPDGGAAAAINRGFTLSSGDILAFLNADDTYLPGAVPAAVRAFSELGDSAVVYGDAWWVDAAGEILKPYPTRAFDPALLASECFISQPAAFFRRSAFESVGGLNPALHYTFDYDLWLRLARTHRMHKIEGYLARSRMHSESKTLGHRREVFEETLSMLKKNCGYAPFAWVYAYACYLVDGRDQFFQPLEPGLFKYALSLPIGLWRNPRRPVRFLREWAAVMSWAGLRRRLRM